MKGLQAEAPSNLYIFHNVPGPVLNIADAVSTL